MKIGDDATQAAISQQESSEQYARIHVSGGLGEYIVLFDDGGIGVYDTNLSKTIHAVSWKS